MLASEPISRAPTGVLPAKSSQYRLLTRPRSASGTWSWMSVLAEVVNRMPAKPSAASNASDTGSSGTSATVPSSRLKAAAPPSRRAVVT